MEENDFGFGFDLNYIDKFSVKGKYIKEYMMNYPPTTNITIAVPSTENPDRIPKAVGVMEIDYNRIQAFFMKYCTGPKAIKETIEKARATLHGGTSLVVFPEGSRTFTGHMGLFRKGAFQLADDLQLPVVPVTIDGSFDVLTRMAGLNFVKRHTMRLVIHKPIYPTSHSPEDIKQTMEESYRVIMAALPEKYQGYVKNEDQ